MEGSASMLGKLLEIQRELKVGKNQYNSFGGFSYRSKEDILEAAKPLCHERGLVIVCEDSVEAVADGWVYVKTVAAIADVETGIRVQTVGWAREPKEKKGMDASQITGTAASYSGKRALGNLFAIDDTADSDAASEPAKPEPPAGPFIGHCKSCGARYQFADAAQFEAFAANPGCCPAPFWEAE